MSILYTRDGAVVTLTLDRPAVLNALSLDALAQLRTLLSECQDDDGVRAIVLTGAGQRAFCTGTDLAGMPVDGGPEAQAMFQSAPAAAARGWYVRLMDLNDLGLRKPVVAAVNGHCLGGGLELALQCDLRIASRTASFGLPEVGIGSIPGVSGVHRLRKAIAHAPAMQMALTGERIDAEAALRWGLVSELCAPEALLDRAQALAGRIADNAPLAVQAVKTLASRTEHLAAGDAQELTERYWGWLRETEDRREGRAAFAARRKPVFVGR